MEEMRKKGVPREAVGSTIWDSQEAKKEILVKTERRSVICRGAASCLHGDRQQ